MTISERIFYLLEKQNKRQADLVRVLDVRPNTVSDWKAKRRNPSAEHLEKAAEFFGVTVDYIVTGREYTPPLVNQGIIGNRNSHNTITVNGNAPRELSEIETELLRICSTLDTRRKTELLTCAYNLEKTED